MKILIEKDLAETDILKRIIEAVAPSTHRIIVEESRIDEKYLNIDIVV